MISSELQNRDAKQESSSSPVPSASASRHRSRITAPEFISRKQKNIPISMVTCYDFWSASIIAGTDIDCILVGDSSAMVMHGYPSTLPATVDMIALHIAAVRRGAPQTFIIGDMPFMTEVGSIDSIVSHARTLMQAGANAVKLEGAVDGYGGSLAAIELLVRSGVPVMGHLGLTPQSVNSFGGYRVQGRAGDAREKLIEDARRLEEAGCFAIVLECVPEELGIELAEKLTVPVIGIGAGSGVDGQVLVLHDLLGLTPGKTPRFVRKYLDGAALIHEALESFHKDILSRTFPDKAESYT
jgi:3-methyl-2-oxobutanoate hydroxymethyltransferase